MAQLPPVSRLAVISDIHLGRGDGETGYGGSAEHLCRVLETIADSVDAVVINGDLYDLDRGVFPLAQGREYRHLQPTWAAVEACMQEHGIRLIAGNHDRALLGRDVAGARVHERYTVPVGGFSVHIEHGERFDAWIKRSRRFTSFFTWFSGWLSRRRFRSAYRMLRAFEAWATDDKDGGNVKRAAAWLRSSRGYDVLVMGHTHQTYVAQHDTQWVLNPGDAMHETMHYLVIDGLEQCVIFSSIGTDGVPKVSQQLALRTKIGEGPA